MSKKPTVLRVGFLVAEIIQDIKKPTARSADRLYALMDKESKSAEPSRRINDGLEPVRAGLLPFYGQSSLGM